MIAPLRLLLISFLIWLFFYIQVPVTYLYTGTPYYAFITIILFLFSFVMGYISIKHKSIKTQTEYSVKKVKQIAILFFLLGLLGILIKLYIGFYVSKIYVTENIFRNRLENMGQELSGGFLGVISALLFPFAYINLLIVTYNYKLFSKLFIFLSLLSGIYPMIETYFMGGRTIIALLGATLLFVTIASYYKNNTIAKFKIKVGSIKLLSIPLFLLKKKIWIPLVILGSAFMYYSASVVKNRLETFNYRDTIKVWERKDYQWVEFDEDFKEEYRSLSKSERNLLLSGYSFKHYFVHGMFEYVRMVNDLDSHIGYHYGQYQFSVFFKFFRVFGIPLKTSEDLNSMVKRKAVYQTFWGPFYLDFGFLGIIVIFFWGRFTKKIYVSAKSGSTPHVIFYGYLSTIIFTSFFLNFLLGSSSYYLFAFFICLFMFKYWPNNLKFVAKG